MSIYQLSNKARAMTLTEWKRLGGCGLSNCHRASVILGPESHWPADITLGQIEDACAFTGRNFAGFAVRRLGAPDLAQPYKSPDQVTDQDGDA